MNLDKMTTDEELKYLEAMERRSYMGELPSEDFASMESDTPVKPKPLAPTPAAPAAGKSTVEKVGEKTTDAGTVGANPYVAGAGLALQTVGAVDSAVRQTEQSKIDAYNKKIMAQRSAIRNVFA